MVRLAAHLDQLARSTAARADAVHGIGAQLHQHAAEALWSAEAADHFRSAVALRRTGCQSAAAQLIETAAQLRQLAMAVR